MRQRLLPDQSLSVSDDDDVSEEDETASNNLQSVFSLCRGKLPVTSQVESLKKKRRLSGTHYANMERGPSVSLEEMDVFSSKFENGIHEIKVKGHMSVKSEPRGEHHSDSGDDSISDEEAMVCTKLSAASASYRVQGAAYVGKNKHDECAWSMVVKDAEELACLNTKPHVSTLIGHLPEAKRSYKSGRGRVKPKFSIRSQLPLEELPRFHTVCKEKLLEESSEGPIGQSNIEHRTIENSAAELLEHLQENNEELPCKLENLASSGAVPSMAKLLEDLQANNGLTNGDSDMLLQISRTKERKIHYAGNRAEPYLGGMLDNEDPLEFSGTGMSSEDEDCDKDHSSLVNEKNRQTMADFILVALSACPTEPPLLATNRQAGIGYHGKLQQILQIERDRHVEFLKLSQEGQSPLDDSKCITARILSRLLEAKLTVCHCLLGENPKSSQDKKDCQDSGDDGRNLRRTIIFSSRICDNVELEVGTVLCIHPPWKEVLVNDNEKIILCSYFSQILT